MKPGALIILALFCGTPLLPGQTGANVLVVVNDSSMFSRRIAEYYVPRRSVPGRNVCHVKAVIDEEIPRKVYQDTIEAPIAACLAAPGMGDKILYIVTTLGLPLRVDGERAGLQTTIAAVDSELTLLYGKMHGRKFQLEGLVPNPLFGKLGDKFEHPRFPIYLVTRLAGYDFDDVKRMIDRSLSAADRGKFVIDLNANDNQPGNDWLRAAARALPADRVVLDTTSKPLYDQRDVIGYAAWGSNDDNRKRRFLGFGWLPGAVATEYVSSNSRTFQRPPDNWTLTTWQDAAHFFAGSPQSLTADYIHEGATASTGHVSEPYLATTPRPDLLLPAYASGRNLAESYYLSIRGLSWQNIVVGDPLCRLVKR